MSNNTMTSDLLGVVEHRVEFLDFLETNSADKRTLIDELGHSRSTVDRAVRELEAFNLITYQDGEYTATLCGELAKEEYKQVTNHLECLCELQPFLQWMPNHVFDLDLDWLTDAELWLPEPANPYAMVNRHVNQLKQTTELRALLPLVGSHAHEAVREIVYEEDADVELVVEPAAADTLQSKTGFADTFEKLAIHNQYRVFVYDGSIPCYIGVLDDLVQIGVDDDGEPRAILESPSDNVRDWAEQKYTEYKQQAKQLV